MTPEAPPTPSSAGASGPVLEKAVSDALPSRSSTDTGFGGAVQEFLAPELVFLICLWVISMTLCPQSGQKLQGETGGSAWSWAWPSLRISQRGGVLVQESPRLRWQGALAHGPCLITALSHLWSLL